MDLIVLDTNVVVSALRSRRGASFAILRSIGERWKPLISVPLIPRIRSGGTAGGRPAQHSREIGRIDYPRFLFLRPRDSGLFPAAAISARSRRRVPART